MRSIFASVLIALVLVGSLPLASLAATGPTATTRALWVWNINLNYDELVKFTLNPPGTNAVPYTHLFLDAGDAMRSNSASLRKLLSDLHAANVEVELLTGDSSWVATDAAIAGGLSVCKAFATFQSAATNPAERFDGLHLDVEPYTLKGWTSENVGSDGFSASIQDRYMSYMTQCKKTIGADNLSVDIPYWLDITNLFNRMDSSIFHHVAVMSYRPTYAAFDATVNKLLSAAKGKFNMIFGVETGPAADLAALSYNGKGYNAVNNDINKIADKYQNVAGFGGVAVHYYSQFKTFAAGNSAADPIPALYKNTGTVTPTSSATTAPARPTTSAPTQSRPPKPSTTLTTVTKSEMTKTVDATSSVVPSSSSTDSISVPEQSIVTVNAPVVTVTHTSVTTLETTLTITQTLFAGVTITESSASSSAASSSSSSVKPTSATTTTVKPTSATSTTVKPTSATSTTVKPTSATALPTPTVPSTDQEIVVMSGSKKLPGKDSRSMWFWSAYDTIKTKAGIDAVINFCVAPHGNPDVKIHRVYAEIDPNMFTDSTGKSQISSFIDAAHQNGILVELLAGAPGGLWAYTQTDVPVTICKQVLDFNDANSAKFDGIHFDIEPHTLGAAIWRANPATANRQSPGSSSGTDAYNPVIEENYMNIMRTCKQMMADRKSSMTLAADVGSDYAYYVFALWNSIMSEKVLDYIGIMNYFNTLNEFMLGGGNDPSAQQGAIYNLKRASIPVVLGAETIGAPYAPAAITYAGKGYKALEAMLSDAHGLLLNSTSFNGTPIENVKSFGGLAVHHYASYLPMAALPDTVSPSGNIINGACKPNGNTLSLADVGPDVKCIVFYQVSNGKYNPVLEAHYGDTAFGSLTNYDSKMQYSVEYYLDSACSTYSTSFEC